MTSDRYANVGCVLLAIVFVAGCGAPQGYNVEHYGGDLNVENGTFQMTGTVYVGSANVDDVNYTDVQVVLYDDDREVIERAHLGTISTWKDEEQSVNVTSAVIPTYVLIESPDFWTSEYDLTVEAFVLVDGEYEIYVRGSLDDRFETQSNRSTTTP